MINLAGFDFPLTEWFTLDIYISYFYFAIIHKKGMTQTKISLNTLYSKGIISGILELLGGACSHFGPSHSINIYEYTVKISKRASRSVV